MSRGVCTLLHNRYVRSHGSVFTKFSRSNSPSYPRILVSPLESRTKRPRLYTEVQDSAATGLLPTKTLHACLSEEIPAMVLQRAHPRSYRGALQVPAPNSYGTLLAPACGLKATARCATEPDSHS